MNEMKLKIYKTGKLVMVDTWSVDVYVSVNHKTQLSPQLCQLQAKKSHAVASMAF